MGLRVIHEGFEIREVLKEELRKKKIFQDDFGVVLMDVEV